MQIKIFYVDFDKTDRDQRWDASRGETLPEGCYTKVDDRELHPSRAQDTELEVCESVFCRMQGEGDDPPVTNTKGERIRSMSVGDLVQIGDSYYICDRVGFRGVSPLRF
jgi:hypothetical protein